MRSADLFEQAAEEARRYRAELADRPVGVPRSREELLLAADSVLPEEGKTPDEALRALIRSAEGALVGSAGPRYFGFVIGGSTPTSVAADWLTSAWDQNAQAYGTSPAASIVEEIVAAWLLDLLDLPRESGVGFVTGAQMANFTALTVARNAVLRAHGWDIEAEGLQAAPHVDVVCGEGCHATIRTAIRLMGLGDRNVRWVRADAQGRIDLPDLERTLADCAGPTIVCAQAGNVNSGAFDSMSEVVALTRPRRAWLHVDGAFGLWARTSRRFAPLARGVEDADSWATDAHKLLNVPYDSGIVIVRDRQVHQSLKTARCAYAGPVHAERRDGSQWVPENSRRARGFVLYTALRNLGRSGVRRLVEHCCDLAQDFAAGLAALPGVRLLNEVVYNQILLHVEPGRRADLDAFHNALALRIQEAGVCWIGTTQWLGQAALRISVSNASTTREDVERSVASLADAIAAERGATSGRVDRSGSGRAESAPLGSRIPDRDRPR